MAEHGQSGAENGMAPRRITFTAMADVAAATGSHRGASLFYKV